MTKFVYIGGKQPTAGDAETTDAPRDCFAFGLNWVQGVPLDVTPDKFATHAHYQNAIQRLETNRFFERVTVEDAVFEEVVPDKPAKGKKAKAIAAPAEDLPE